MSVILIVYDNSFVKKLQNKICFKILLLAQIKSKDKIKSTIRKKKLLLKNEIRFILNILAKMYLLKF